MPNTWGMIFGAGENITLKRSLPSSDCRASFPAFESSHAIAHVLKVAPQMDEHELMP